MEYIRAPKTSRTASFAVSPCPTATDREAEEAIELFGLTLTAKATVIDLFERFDARLLKTGSSQQRRVNAKLLMGIPTVAFHKSLLSDDLALVREVGPHVENMVEKMLTHGDGYTHGENFNRAVILGLHLIAQRAKEVGQ